ncbi:MAG: FAD-dependent oxidoreductase [Pseudomonadota bacterium]
MASVIHNPIQDITIVGGGIVGLWCARLAAKRGLKVRLVEKRTLGSGASGGMLGALMPHHPGGWSEKKGFQLKGLLTLPESISELENDIGQSCGYARVGRIQPIGHPEKRRQSQTWVEGATDNWPNEQGWHIKDNHPAPGWADEIAENGWNTDTLSARINPRRFVGALAKWAQEQADIDVREGEPAIELSPDAPTILAAGLGCFALIDPENPGKIGKGVKGQGALLKPARTIDPNNPIIYDNGTYVIAHADGTIAVGSTSENEFTHPTTTDEKLDAIIEDAKRICPPLKGAEVIERWAGVRPKAGKPDPLLGPLPRHENVIVATGGFKITFAIAHVMADAAIRIAIGEDAEVPEQFAPKNRLPA